MELTPEERKRVYEEEKAKFKPRTFAKKTWFLVLFIAVCFPLIYIVGALVDGTLLEWASYHGQVVVAKLSLDMGASVNENRNKTGETPLIWAAQQGHVDVAKLLLARGANLGAQKTTGATALIEAASNGHVEVARLLLDKGAPMNERTNDTWSLGGQTALMWASIYGHVGVVKILVDRGADVDTKDNAGRTALMLASMKNRSQVVELLTKYSDEAKRLLKFAQEGDSDVQYKLGLMYQKGEGVPKDRSAAIEWYRKAAAQGNKDAQEQLRKLGASLDEKSDFRKPDDG